MFFLGGAQHCCALLRCTDVHRPPDCHSERSRPTFSFAFAPAKASACGCEESLFLFHLFAAPLTSSHTPHNNHSPANHRQSSRLSIPPPSAPRPQSSAESRARPGCSELLPPDPAPPAPENQ